MKRRSTDDIVGAIRAERYRQIQDEGWTPAHDDEHELGEMAVAAACYAKNSTENYSYNFPPDDWPWEFKWWKQKDPRQDLIRAAALIVAEIERLDRAADLQQQSEHKNG